MSTFVVDVDNTICISESGCDYSQCEPIQPVIDKINNLFDRGDTIILFTARGMKTYNSSLHNINIFIRPVLEEWLEKHNVKYDQLIVGKPWGPDVYYIDDRAFRPDEFIERF